MREPNTDELKEEFDLGILLGKKEMRYNIGVARGLLLSLFDLGALTREDIVHILSI